MIGLILGAIGALVAAAVTVSKALAVVGLAVEGLKVVGNAIMGIAKALGIIKPERKVEDLGDRAFQAEEKGLKPENYPTYVAWVQAIDKDDWGYNPEKNKDMPVEQKVLKGVEVSTAVTMERFPKLPILGFFTTASKNPGFFTVERLDEIGKLASTDSKAFGEVVNYVTGAEKSHSGIESATDILMNIEKTISNDMDDDATYAKVASYYPTQNNK